MFKVGDKVRRINRNNGNDFKVNEEGIFAFVSGTEIWVNVTRVVTKKVVNDIENLELVGEPIMNQKNETNSTEMIIGREYYFIGDHSTIFVPKYRFDDGSYAGLFTTKAKRDIPGTVHACNIHRYNLKPEIKRVVVSLYKDKKTGRVLVQQMKYEIWKSEVNQMKKEAYGTKEYR